MSSQNVQAVTPQDKVVSDQDNKVDTVPCKVEDGIAELPLSAAILVAKPESGATSELSLEAGKKYTLDFAEKDVQTFTQEGDDLTIKFSDGSALHVQNFKTATSGENAAQISFAEPLSDGKLSDLLKHAQTAQADVDAKEEDAPKTEIREHAVEVTDAQPPADDALKSAEDVAEAQTAEEVAKVEPAAGDDADAIAAKLAAVEPAAGGDAAGGISSGRGYGFQSSFEAQGVIGLDDVGPIDPTALQYGIEYNEEFVFPQTRETTPELPPLNPVFELDNQQVYEDGSVALGLIATPDSANGVMTIIISGIPAGWDVSNEAYDSLGNLIGTGTFDAVAGTWTITTSAGSSLNGGPVFTPPADSDVDALNLTLSISETDSTTGQSGAASGGFNIIVDAVADAPDVDALNNSGKEGDVLAINISGLTGEEVNNGAGADDGSEAIVHYEIAGVPAGFTLSAGVETAPGSGVFVLSAAELAGLTITPPAGFFGSINLTATIYTTETPVTDGEFDLTNNDNQASDAFVLTWKPVANPPELCVNNGVDNAQVKEDGSVDVPIVATLDPAGSGNEILSVTVTGIDSSWGFTAPVGTYDAVAGTWTITLAAGENLSTIFTFTPPADSDLDLSGLQATASAYEPATDTSANATPDDFNIIVDAVADAPSIDANGSWGYEGAVLGISLSALTGEEVNNGAGSDDGSEIITGYRISGVPAGFTLSAGTEVAPGVYDLTPAEIAGLTVTPPHANYAGLITLTATVFTTENPVSDTEFDLSDNHNMASDQLTLKWKPVINPPSIEVNNGVDDAVVKEDGSVDVPVIAQLGANPAVGEYLTVTITGIDPSWGNFSAPMGTYNPATGTWTVTLGAGENLSTVLTFTPNADSDLDLSGLVATVVATDPDAGISANDNDAFNVITDAVSDAPDVDGLDNSGLKGTPLNVDISGAAGDTDGSETIVKYQVSDVPSGFVFNQGTDIGGGVWEFTPAELTGLQITPPADFIGDFNLTVTIFTTENPVDGEVDTTDNTATANDVFNLEWKPVANPPALCVNNGVDDAIVKEDGSVDVPIVATLDPDGSGNEILSVTVTGIDSSWGFTAPVGTYNPATGTWTITLGAGENLFTVFTFTPPADSDLDLSGLQATASAYEPATNTSANATPDDFNIIVDAVADVPNLDASNAGGEEGTIIPLTITTSVNDTDGSEVIEVVKIGGVPAGVTLTAGIYDVVEGVWKLAPSDLVGLGMNVPHGVTGNFILNIESVAFEQNIGGSEYDLSDNRASAFDKVEICITPDHQPVLVQPELVKIDETNLAPTTFVSGTVEADFGDDTPGVFAGNGTSVIGNLKSGGVDVAIGFNALTNTYTGTAGAETIFTMVIEQDGDYTFTLLGTVDHPDTANHNDYLALQFGVQAIDNDGDHADGFITVKVYDDGLDAVDDYVTMDVADGLVSGSVVPNDDFSQDDPNTVTQISFDGTSVNVDPTTGAIINGAYGQLEIHIDGTYTYTLFDGATGGTRDIFHYTLRDGDGDTDIARLKISTAQGTLIVGKNVDDVPGSQVPHLVGGGDGEIEGSSYGDILVGDAGGSFTEEQTQDYNFVFILDVSGSMGSKQDAASKISLLKSAVASLLTDIADYDGGDVKVHIVPFATQAGTGVTYTITNAGELTNLLSYLNTLNGDGYTNYEDPMQKAIQWLQSGQPLGGNAITTTYFISDGEPNRYVNDSGSVREGNASVVMGQITGSDGTNEVALLKSLSDEVIAVGINIGSNISNLHVIDSDGSALNIDDPNDLTAVLAGTNPLEKLLAVGGDELVGGEGKDIIFGDVLFTDDLAAAHGLTAEDGSGWAVFEQLEAGQSAVDSGWTRQDTIEYIRNNAETLAQESVDAQGDGRFGGDDVITGGGGDDLIFGQEGNDHITGGAGDDVLFGGSGADMFVFETIVDGVDTIVDFNGGEGDRIDISSVLSGFDPINDNIADFVIATESAGNTVVSFDVSGQGGAMGSVDFALLLGVTGLDLDVAMKSSAV